MKNYNFVLLGSLMLILLLSSLQAAPDKGDPDRYDTDGRGLVVGEENADGSVDSPDKKDK